MAMPAKTLPTTIRWNLRTELLELLISTAPRGSIQGHMLAVDAMVRFIETGEIVGLSPAVDDVPVVAKRKAAGAASRVR